MCQFQLYQANWWVNLIVHLNIANNSLCLLSLVLSTALSNLTEFVYTVYTNSWDHF